MALSFDKAEIRSSLSIDNIFDILVEWGGEPEYTDFGILSSTICHNLPGEGSHKLYYYENSGLFRCYTGCQESFDIFELTMKVAEIQSGKHYDLNDAVRFIAFKFGIIIHSDEELEQPDFEDWKILNSYDRIQKVELKNNDITLQEYDQTILSRLNYTLRIEPWLREGITQEMLDCASIGYYLGGDQITIPHFDKDGRFVGLRGRTMCKEEAERYGKYRPLTVNKNLYNHPLGMNLYGLNWSKDNIRLMKKAIVFESEKSVLLYGSYFGPENNISVACCGSNLSVYQVQLLLDAGAEEIIIAFDRQFQEIGDKEFKHLTANLTKIHNKYKGFATISFIFDKNKITGYKDSPIDCGREKFLQLFKERILL